MGKIGRKLQLARGGEKTRVVRCETLKERSGEPFQGSCPVSFFVVPLVPFCATPWAFVRQANTPDKMEREKSQPTVSTVHHRLQHSPSAMDDEHGPPHPEMGMGDPHEDFEEQVDFDIPYKTHDDVEYFHESSKRSREDDELLEDEDFEETNAKRAKVDSNAKKINAEQWNDMFERLKVYKEEHGDCLVPKRYSKEPKLGTWVETQRVQFKRLLRTIDEVTGTENIILNKRLNQERLDKLNSIGFAWTAKNIRKVKTDGTASKPKKNPEESRGRNKNSDEEFEIMYNRLVAYKNRFGNCLVPRKWEEDPKLATWVETQRVLWNRDYRPYCQLLQQQVAGHELTLPEPVAVHEETQPIPYVGKSPEEWAEEMVRFQGGGATAEDAAEIGPIMEEEMNDPQQDEALVAAAVEAAEAAVEAARDSFEPPSEESRILAAQTKRLSSERKAKLDEIGFVWSLRSKRIEDHWEEMFHQLQKYKEKHGDCLVPSRYEENLKLGKWVETQRYEYTKSQRIGGETIATQPDNGKPKSTNPRLTDERRQRLESIGFEWKVKNKMKRYYEKQWNQMFEKLLKFKEENGHTLVPKRYPDDQKLATWVHTQRVQHRKLISGGKETDVGTENAADYQLPGEEISYRLTDERRKRLEEIGFVWSAREGDKAAERVTRNSYDSQWDAMFSRLLEYKAKNGDCLVPKRYAEDPKLGTWVDTQRVQYKKLQKKLEDGGSEDSFKYGEASNEASASFATSSESGPSAWKVVMGRLTDDRIRRLEEVGFVWSLRDDWKKHFEELKSFKAEHGHCNVPARYAKNRRLGIWVSAQRQQYKALSGADASLQRSTPLTQERINMLSSIGFTWTIRSRDTLGESWNQRLQDLKNYKALHGNCLVPSRYPPCPELGVWVGTQRTQYRLYIKARDSGHKLSGATSMNEERIKQLEELGFVWALRGTDSRRDSLQAGIASVAALDTRIPTNEGQNENRIEMGDETVLAVNGETAQAESSAHVESVEL